MTHFQHYGTCGGCAFDSQTAIDKPALLRNALIRAGRWLEHATPEEVASTVPEAFLAGDRATYVQAFEKVRDGYSANGMISAEGAQDMVNALAAFDPKIKPAEINVAETFTNQFAQRFAKDAH